MSTISEIKLRLLEASTPFTLVKGATALAQVKDRPDAVLPVAYVVATKEISAENMRATGRTMQRTERDIMIVIVCEDLGDSDGDTVQDPLEELKTFVRGKLLGFVPSDTAGEPLTHVGGEVIEAASGCVWFADTFSAPTYLQETI